jgi:hypothetical protein
MISLVALVASMTLTEIPKGFLEATTYLAANGMGDARGAEYREAEILPSPSLYGRSGKPITIHGWVRKDRKVVAWDGLVYVVIAVGPVANLDRDLDPKVKEKAEAGGFFLYGVPHPDQNGPMQPTGLALLILAGRTDLARLNFEDRSDPTHVRTGGDLVSHFAYARLGRVAGAFASSDNATVSREGRGLLAFSNRLDRRDLSFQTASSQHEEGKPYLQFLDELPKLVDDADRRLSNKAGLDLKEIAALPQPERIKKLIAALENVRAHGFINPGGPLVMGDEIVRALVREGEAAIAPLQLAVDHDKRLTRAGGIEVHFFLPSCHFVSVSQVAQYAILEILKSRGI